jgi:hypothetical protein
MKKVQFKFIHNIFIMVVFLILMDPKAFLGEWFHEWAGLLIGLFYILHKALNWNWIKSSSKKMFGKLPGRVRLNYIMDLLLLLSFIFIIWSGMEISKSIDFSWLGIERGQKSMVWKSLHTGLSMLVIIILGIHLGLHWDWVVARFKRSK